MLSINEIRDKVFENGKLINAPLNLLSIPDKPIGDGSPHIEITDNFYYYIVSERGMEFQREETDNIDVLLYWIFSDITSSMSFDYELKNRIANQDCRRLIFNKQLDLLAKINKKWADKEAEKIRLTLEKNPYVDT